MGAANYMILASSTHAPPRGGVRSKDAEELSLSTTVVGNLFLFPRRSRYIHLRN